MCAMSVAMSNVLIWSAAERFQTVAVKKSIHSSLWQYSMLLFSLWQTDFSLWQLKAQSSRLNLMFLFWLWQTPFSLWQLNSNKEWSVATFYVFI